MMLNGTPEIWVSDDVIEKKFAFYDIHKLRSNSIYQDELLDPKQVLDRRTWGQTGGPYRTSECQVLVRLNRPS